MKLVIVHGYLLQGTGSNIYVANIAKAWCALGHQVIVVCQDPDSPKLPFVEEYFGPGQQLPASWPGPKYSWKGIGKKLLEPHLKGNNPGKR